MRKILTLTLNPAIDKTTRTETVVGEKKLHCTAPRYEPGGGGINVARAIHKLGGRATAIYPAGGPMAPILNDLLTKEGIGIQPIEIAGWTRENLIVSEEATEQQYRFGMPGAKLSEQEWHQCRARMDELESVDYLVASGSLPPGAPDDAYGQIAELARKHQARLIVDTRGEPLKQASQVGVFLLKPNLRELGELIGEEIKEEKHQEQAARKLIEQGACEVLVLSMGAAGVLLVTADDMRRIRSPSVPIRSKVGAGDSTVGGIVHALSQNRPLVESVCFGVAAGGAAVMTPGTELCRREDTERLFQRLWRQT